MGGLRSDNAEESVDLKKSRCKSSDWRGARRDVRAVSRVGGRDQRFGDRETSRCEA